MCSVPSPKGHFNHISINVQLASSHPCFSIGLPLWSLKTWSVQVTEALVFLAACVEHAYIHTYIHDTQILSPQAFFLALLCLTSVYSSVSGKPWFQDANKHIHLFYPETQRKQLQNHGTGNTPQNKPTEDAQVTFSSFPQIRIMVFFFRFLKLYSTSLRNLLERQRRLTHSSLSNQSSSISGTQAIEMSFNNFSLIYNKHRY